MNNINIIDIEASGLGFDSYPIDIAVLIGSKSKSWLIKPEPMWNHWDVTAENLHGITREQLDEEGLVAIEVLNKLIEFVDESNGVLYSDAAYWDADWIDTLFFALKQKRYFHIESIYELLDQQQSIVFDKNKMMLSKSGKYRHHRAEEDVNMILEAYQLTVLGG